MIVTNNNLSYSYAVNVKLNKLINECGIEIVEGPLWDAEGFVFSLIKTVPYIS